MKYNEWININELLDKPLKIGEYNNFDFGTAYIIESKQKPVGNRGVLIKGKFSYCKSNEDINLWVKVIKEKGRKMKTKEMEIKIRDKNFMLTLEKNDLCDEGWLDLTIENIENGRCTSYGIEEAEILQTLMPLIDTDWVLGNGDE